MRTSRALLLGLVTTVLCAVTVALAPPGAAGGPTSVLIVDADNGRAAALYASDERYAQLTDLVGADGTLVRTSEQPPGSVSGSGTASGGVVTVTWLAHDVHAWRVDRIHLEAPGGPWIGSHLSGDDGSIGDGDPSWHRPSDPEGLVTLLGALGLGSAGTGAPTAGDTTPGSQADAPRTATPATAAPAALPQNAPGGPLWGFGGMLLGAVLVLGLGRVRQVVRRVPDDGDAGQDRASDRSNAYT